MGIVLFYSTSAAFKLVKALEEAGVEAKLVPTPRELSSDCGTALRFPWERRPEVSDAIEEIGLEVAGIHRL